MHPHTKQRKTRRDCITRNSSVCVYLLFMQQHKRYVKRACIAIVHATWGALDLSGKLLHEIISCSFRDSKP